MASDEGDYEEVTSGLSGERYAVVNREEGLAEMKELPLENSEHIHKASARPVQEGHSRQDEGQNGENSRFEDNLDHYGSFNDGDKVYDEDEDEDDNDERVLERLRSSSPMGGVSVEKPSLIPNESRFNPIEFLIGSLNTALDSLAFDKTLVIQSKMAGELNNSANEVLKVIDEMEFALKEHILKYDKLKQEILPEIESNLKKGTKMANKLTAYVKETYPVEFSKGRSKILDNLTEDEEGLYS